MKTYDRNNLLPRLWWLFPWATTRELSRITKALLEWGDDADRALELQARVITDQSAEISRLRLQLEDLHDDIIRGRAITPDAYPEGGSPTPEGESPATSQPRGLVAQPEEIRGGPARQPNPV